MVPKVQLDVNLLSLIEELFLFEKDLRLSGISLNVLSVRFLFFCFLLILCQ